MRWWKAKKKIKKAAHFITFITTLVTLVDQSECGCILVCAAPNLHNPHLMNTVFIALTLVLTRAHSHTHSHKTCSIGPYIATTIPAPPFFSCSLIKVFFLNSGFDGILIIDGILILKSLCASKNPVNSCKKSWKCIEVIIIKMAKNVTLQYLPRSE